jgi:hypothetical protein
VPGCATIINDDEGLPGNAFLGIEYTILLRDFSRPVGQQRDVALSLQTSVGPAKRV